MEIRITSKNCDVPEVVKGRANSRLAKLVKYEPRLSSAELIFSEEGRDCRAEAVLSIHGSDQVFAKAEEEDFGSRR